MQKKPTPEKSETQIISASIPKELKKRVMAFCDDNQMTIRDFIADAIIDKLELAHKKSRL